MSRIWLSPPHLNGEEIEFINEAIAGNWVAPLGPQVDAFEKELSDYIGVKSAAALSSGTAAIHLALLILGVKPGDSVLCSSFTFAGSTFPITYCGAQPILIDSEKDTWNISPALLEQSLEKSKKSGKLPKALILVELYGVPARMKEIAEICARYNVPIVEDAAEALGSNYAGKKLGSFGAIGILSFNGNKIITTSGGGALLSDNPEFVQRARFLATQARDPAPHYEHTTIGFNYRMSSIVGAIGRGQLRAIDQRIKQRRENFKHYQELLKSVASVQFPAEFPDAFANRWLTTVLFPSSAVRDRVIAALKAADIESRPLWKPMHMQPVFKDCPSFTNGTSEKLFEIGLCLPSGSALKPEEREEVADIVKRIAG